MIGQIYIWIFDLMTFFVLAAAFYLCAKVSKKLYGGKFTSALPYLLVSITLRMVASLLELAFSLSLPSTTDIDAPYLIGIQLIVMVSNVFILMAVYQIYMTHFVTEGFVEGKQ